MTIKDSAYTNKRQVQCSGNEFPYDHPIVYLEVADDKISCPYCSKTFIYKEIN